MSIFRNVFFIMVLKKLSLPTRISSIDCELPANAGLGGIVLFGADSIIFLKQWKDLKIKQP